MTIKRQTHEKIFMRKSRPLFLVFQRRVGDFLEVEVPEGIKIHDVGVQRTV